MIRIDEIYYNVFASALQEKSIIHWFDPFGTTEIENIHSYPALPSDPDTQSYGQYASNPQIIFYDQEPLHRDRVQPFLDQFLKRYSGPTTIVTSEYNSENVKWITDTYGIDFAYYFFHAWAALDWYRGYNHTFLYKPFRDRTIEKTFLCPNNIIGGKRKHRLELLSELVDRDLVYSNFVSFPEYCPHESKTVAELCKQYNINMGHVDLPLIIDNANNHAGNSHRIDMWEFANRSLLQVVTETVYSGQRQHLTEKTFKPIVMQQPFVLVSCAGSLDYLRRYGFKTFNDFWNEDYDECSDDTRIMRIGKLLNDIDNLSVKEKSQLQQYMAPVVEHNFNWFYSQEFETLLWNELTSMVQSWQ